MSPWPAQTADANGIRIGLTMHALSRMLLIVAAILYSITATGSPSLIGRWSIDTWTSQDDRTAMPSGHLTILDTQSAGGLVGELVIRRLEGRVRQRMKISFAGDQIQMTGEILQSAATYAPDTLTLTLSGNYLAGASMNASEQSGVIRLRRLTSKDFPAPCDAYAFFSTGRKAELITEEDVRRELAYMKKTAATMRAEIPAELARQQAKLGRKGRSAEADELAGNYAKLDAILGCIERTAL
jgi:hypothetical protein